MPKFRTQFLQTAIVPFFVTAVLRDITERHAAEEAVCAENLNPDVVVMKSAQDGK